MIAAFSAALETIMISSFSSAIETPRKRSACFAPVPLACSTVPPAAPAERAASMTVSVWPSFRMIIISSYSKLSSGTAPSGAALPVRNAKVRPPPTLFTGTASMMPLPGISMKSRRLALFMSCFVMSPQATVATSAFSVASRPYRLRCSLVAVPFPSIESTRGMP